MKLRCPSCHGINQHKVDSISRQVLSDGYMQSFQIDITPHVPAEILMVDLLECSECSLRWYSPLFTGSAEFYETLQQFDWYYQGQKPEYVHAASMIPASASVLDVGCGRGAFASHLSNGQRYRGLEFNDVAVKKATAAGLDVVVRSIETEADINPAAYDVVCHFQVLEHVEDSFGFMSACVRALKPGGILLVTVPSEDSFLTVASSCWLNMPPHHVTRWTDKAMQHLAVKLELTMLNVWHEPVAESQLSYYRLVLSAFAVRNVMGMPNRLEDSSFTSRLANRVARVGWLSSWLVNRAENTFQYAGSGHSVCFTARKPDG